MTVLSGTGIYSEFPPGLITLTPLTVPGCMECKLLNRDYSHEIQHECDDDTSDRQINQELHEIFHYVGLL
jgi:hypothetical protein